jgi:hypothetical protein
MKSQTKTTLVIGAVVAASFANATIMIDDFTSGAGSNSLSTGTTYYSQAGTMLGGDRVGSITVTGNAFGLDVSVDTIAGIMSMNSQSGVDALLTTNYGYNLVSPVSTSFEDLNMDFSGENQFEIRTVSRDGDLRIDFLVRNSPNSFVTVSKFLVGSAINTPEVVTWDFSEFAGVDFSNVDQVLVRFDTANSGDVAVDYIKAVPEPATLTILGAAAALAAARRKRKS